MSVDAGAILGSATLLGVDTGVLETRASSNVDGTAGPCMASAASTVDDLALDVVALIPGVNGLVHVRVTSIWAASAVSGDFGALFATGPR